MFLGYLTLKYSVMFMATLSFNKKELDRFITKELPFEKVANAFEMLGMPVDKANEEEIVADITNDRIDMFTVEGAGRAIGQFMGLIGSKEYKVEASELVLNVENVSVRPYAMAFVARGLKIDDEMIRSLIMAQEKIHDTFGRKRKKIAIGIHDVDKVTGPLYYKAFKDISFIPLDTDKEMSVQQILKNHPKGQEYAHIFDNASEYPMFMDSKGVLSFPPIINSERTRLTEKTVNLLFDVTGTSETAVRIVLNVFATAMQERGAKIENIKINKSGMIQDSLVFERKEKLSLKFANKLLGLKLKDQDAISLLDRMGMKANAEKGGLIISVPPYRSDIIHEVDFIEDLAVAYGYENFKPALPKLFTTGAVSEQTKLDYKARDILVSLGFIEINSWTLTNEEMTGKAFMNKESVTIKNPRTSDFTIFRTDLTPSVLQTLAENKTKGLPLKIFEVGRVSNPDGKCRTRLCCAIMSENSSFSDIVSVFNEVKGFAKVFERYVEEEKVKPRLEHLIDGRFILIKKQEDMKAESIGWCGEIHPKVLENFRLEYPVAMFEFDLSPSVPGKTKRMKKK